MHQTGNKIFKIMLFRAGNTVGEYEKEDNWNEHFQRFKGIAKKFRELLICSIKVPEYQFTDPL